MKEIHLAGKKIDLEGSKVLLSYRPDENWQNYFEVKSGDWFYRDGELIGVENGNKGGILFTKQYFDKDVLLKFRGRTLLPATRDLNAVWAARWDDKTDYLGESYVCGLNGWWENKAGIERNKDDGIKALTNAYKYTAGKTVEMICGSVNGHCVMTVDGLLVTELFDPDPIVGGHVGFSAYCTMLAIKDVEVREISFEKFKQAYDPEF